MAGIYPKAGDNDRALWLTIALNLYNYAIAQGVTGLNPPSWNDNQTDLAKKAAYYSASAV